MHKATQSYSGMDKDASIQAGLCSQSAIQELISEECWHYIPACNV